MSGSRSAYMATWATGLREKLIADMGSECAFQASMECNGKLEFDHPEGREWDPSSMNRWRRMAQYRRDFEAGKLRLLCEHHNRSDGGSRRWRSK